MSEAPEIKDVISVVRNRRTDSMFIAAYLAVGVLVYLVVYQTSVGEFAQGVITLVLGVFLNELKNMYSYETGTTRGEMAKSETIRAIAEKTIDASGQRQAVAETVVQDIAKTVPIAAAKAAAAVEVAGTGNGNGAGLKTTGKLNVDATGAEISITDGKLTEDHPKK